MDDDEPNAPKALDRKRRRDEDRAQKQVEDQNLLVTSLLVDFQTTLRAMFRTRKMAFDTLGGRDDARIDFQELHAFLERLGYNNANLNRQLFAKLDNDGDGFISRIEFKALFEHEGSDLAEFKELLREAFKSRKEAFDELGGKNDGYIDREEFHQFVKRHLGLHDKEKNDRIFDSIDDSKDGLISNAEFKAIFQPDGEMAKVVEFKEALRSMFKTRKQAFDRLGGRDDKRIDQQEFQTFLREELHYTDPELNDQLFNLIDDDHNGYISKGEFEALFLRHTAKVVELKGFLKDLLKDKFKTRKEAFNKLGGSDDARIDRQEFTRFMKQDMGRTSAEEIDELFDWMDKDHDGHVSKEEFKQFF